LLWAAELPRAALTVASLPFSRSLLAGAPRGDGRPVMILPGLANSDRSNFVMRRYLRSLGYRAEGWGLGRNFGVRTVGADADRIVHAARMFVPAGPRPTLYGDGLAAERCVARLGLTARADRARPTTIGQPS